MIESSPYTGEATFATIARNLTRRLFIIYAARLSKRPGWRVGALKGRIGDVKRWHAQAGEVVIKARQLGGPVTQANTLIAERRAQDLGWYKDLNSGCWYECHYSLLPAPSSPEVREALAVSFAPPESGWIKGVVAIAHPRSMADFLVSNLWGPEPLIVRWLEEVARGGYPSITFAEEQLWKEFLVLPGDHLKELGCLEYPEPEFVRFCVVRRWPDASHRELDVVLPRLALVRSIYRAWLSCHDDDPRRFREEWTIFAESELTPEHPFQRSEMLDRWIAEAGGSLIGCKSGRPAGRVN
ncbi:hypothetical protein [Xanthobacter autotrophicus]|uniref:hypothetical protein n=1 Tax=Xanthobacter autotrophicus TaxID=280 RepID=UPI0037286940